MPFKLEVKVSLQTSSVRVKYVEPHPIEPWVLSALYSGEVQMWNYSTKELMRTFEVAKCPVRCAKFVARKNWVLAGSDDAKLSVFNMNTAELLSSFECHADYVRSIAIHPTLPIVLTSSDDCKIKSWNFDKKWALQNTFDAHSHYVMQIVFNPKDPNVFASTSLDKTYKIWNLNSANSTVSGPIIHEKGVNCINFSPSPDRPYLITGADDKLAKIWDFQTQTHVQTLQYHAGNVSAVLYHPVLPLIFVASEDGFISVWHSVTYRFERKLTPAIGRIWGMAYCSPHSSLAVCGDDGTVVLKVSHEDMTVSMDGSGNMIYSNGFDIYKSNVKMAFEEDEGEAQSSSASSGEANHIKDGEELSLSNKMLGTCEVYPQKILHSSNGRYFTVTGDGEFVIYSSMGFRASKFGKCSDFAWSKDSNTFALSSGSNISINCNFNEKCNISTTQNIDRLFGGELLAAACASDLLFYEWDQPTEPIARIEVSTFCIYWNENTLQCAICSDKNFFILQYHRERALLQLQQVNKRSKNAAEEVADVFEIIDDCPAEGVTSGLWIGDVFCFIDKQSRLCHFIGGELSVLTHLDSTHVLLGYLPLQSRLVVSDHKKRVSSYKIERAVLEFQTAILRNQEDLANEAFSRISKREKIKMARFLEKQGRLEQALETTSDPNHKFDLAIKLNMLDVAAEVASLLKSQRCWTQLCHLALNTGKIDMALKCMWETSNFSGLLLLAVVLRDKELLQRVESSVRGSPQMRNIWFMASRLLGHHSECVTALSESGEHALATTYSLTHDPKSLKNAFDKWKLHATKEHARTADSIASPFEYPNLFSSDALKIVNPDPYFSSILKSSNTELPIININKDEVKYQSYNIPESSLIDDTQDFS